MDLAARHFTFGWRALLVFLTLGLALEALHGLKVDWYLSAGLTTRRHMLTLGHAHGTLLSLVNIAFAAWAGWRVDRGPPPHPWSSLGLRLATVAMPLGFLLGGLDVRGGDPGLGIVLVPIGGLCLLTAVALCALRR